ncbi:Na(+)/H(+) antiporter subunit B [Acidipila rosea]|uniref:Uncharacterized protein DUF4040 n=1 Tax=Acidipila rosea TaxID=768535 RepID=A0A4R1L5U8_9BACT|nr:DUF4040 domain-containing protein [Acidipila rosea]MBW4026484.1 DUF4040 domain-containing protein [Acidobacteriota bacterium]MBW4044380.1 DUF4040 domain-containing protein [Acidobacteriota bacterium]TCK72557.1 uncharacterized protein DUF4040 [Acidipila rosea]
MTIFRMLLLSLIGLAALGVVRTRDLVSQVLALTFYGMLLAVMFFAFQAPDVALSQIVIGAVALPLMIMLVLARMRHRERTLAEQKDGR